MDGHLTKPEQLGDLRAALERGLGGNEGVAQPDRCAETESASQGTDDAATASSLPLLCAEAASVRAWIRVHYADM